MRDRASDEKADMEAALDRGESVGLMGPMLLAEESRHRGALSGTRCPRDHSMNVLRIGIISMDAFKARAIAMAKGVKSKPGEPKIWFNSAQSIGKLIDDNWPLLQEIRRRPPQSITELGGRTGRSVSNLSRTLKSLEQRGLVSLHAGEGLNKRPVVAYDRIEIVTVPFADAA